MASKLQHQQQRTEPLDAVWETHMSNSYLDRLNGCLWTFWDIMQHEEITWNVDTTAKKVDQHQFRCRIVECPLNRPLNRRIVECPTNRRIVECPLNHRIAECPWNRRICPLNRRIVDRWIECGTLHVTTVDPLMDTSSPVTLPVTRGNVTSK